VYQKGLNDVTDEGVLLLFCPALLSAVNHCYVTRSSPAAVAQDHAEAGKSENVPDKTAEVKPQDVLAGFGKIKFNGLIQTLFVGGNGGFSDTFRLRRARIRLTGEMTPEAKWTISFELARTQLFNRELTTINGSTVVRDSSFNPSNHILQDAFITFSHLKRMNISIGDDKRSENSFA